MSHVETSPGQYRTLMRKVERFVQTLDRSDDPATTVRDAAEAILAEFRDELGLFGGRVYRRVGESYTLQSTFGEAKTLPEGLEIPVTYPPIRRVRERGTLLMDPAEPGFDPELEDELGVQKFAAIEVGQGDFILAFNVLPGPRREEIVFSLGILRHSIDQQLRQGRFEDIFKQARIIQASILPSSKPTYGPFQFGDRSEPMESVGGDYYDYIPITDKALGLAIADVSGHGLPAALQVRDIYTGLRMGLGRDFKIVRTVERLNRIIHESTLTSRFVSMFYGELELNGLFIFVNAGHPAPFQMSADGSVTRLRQGGPVLGPLRESTYERGIITLQPGDLLVLYTDGIIEASSPGQDDDEELGIARLIETVRRNRQREPQEVADAIFEEVERFTGGQPPNDDRTVVVVRYQP